MFVGWWDSELEIKCFFAPQADGSFRCMPMGYANVNNYFLDTGCLVPIAYSGKEDCTPKTYAFRAPLAVAPACELEVQRIFDVVSAYSGAVYQRSTPTSPCTAITGGWQLDGYNFWRITPANINKFAHMTLETDD